MPVICKKCGFMNSDVSIYCDECKVYLPSAVPSKNLDCGTKLNNRYEIIRIIKSGGMGKVYEALDNGSGKSRCAVKEMIEETIDPSEKKYMIKSFKREAELLESLNHQNLPVVIDHFVENNSYYLVMEYIDGKDLEEITDTYSSKKLPETLVIEWSLQILDALHYLHSQSPPVIYRDLKPGNIMLRASDNRIFLIDFGIAKRINPISEEVNTRIGTSVFAPLELLQGKPEARSDIYSLGATMHCLLTSIIPSVPMSFKPIRKINPAVTNDMASIVMKSLAGNLDDRYKNAMEMKKDLEKLSIGNIDPALKETILKLLMNKKNGIN